MVELELMELDELEDIEELDIIEDELKIKKKNIKKVPIVLQNKIEGSSIQSSLS